MRCALVISSVAFCLCLSCAALAGPFGTEMGQKPEAFSGLREIDKTAFYTSYATSIVPRKNTLFPDYSLTFGEDGLALVVGVSKEYKNDAYGTQVREDYEKIKKQLTEKYGQPESFDFLKRKSIWNKDRYFATSLFKKERRLESFWTKNLPDNLESIHLYATASSPSETSFSLIYEYKNFDKIRRKVDKASKDAL